ncbi:MAG TPA: hypothetical protein VFU24_05885 [Burkholderiales bacterium]|nr:hypothetical protein [Burkholderiales bacterium]
MASVLLILAGAVPVLFLAGLLAWQTFTLFQAGAWVPLPVLLLFTDHAALQATKVAPVLGFIPDLSLIWTAGADTAKPVLWALGRVHFALLPALAGLVMMAAGVRGFFMKRAALRAQRDYREDRLRRVQDYRRDDSATDTFDGRREPFISGLAGMPAAQKNPAQRGARAG